MTHKSFAIVCDSTCGLPSEHLARLEVVCVAASPQAERPARHVRGYAAREVFLPAAEDYLATFEDLAKKGYERVACVVSSLQATGTWSAVEEAQSRLGSAGLSVRSVDAGVTSLALGMVVERLAAAREHGVEFEEAVRRAHEFSREVRLLFIPSSSAPFALRDLRAERRGLMGRASALRVRIAGERSLYLLWRGEATALARSTDLADLCARAAHAMSAVAAKEGELVYALTAADDSDLRFISKPLKTNEFEAALLGRVPADPSFLANTGPDVIAAAFVPKRFYDRAAAPTPAGSSTSE